MCRGLKTTARDERNRKPTVKYCVQTAVRHGGAVRSDRLAYVDGRKRRVRMRRGPDDGPGETRLVHLPDFQRAETRSEHGQVEKSRAENRVKTIGLYIAPLVGVGGGSEDGWIARPPPSWRFLPHKLISYAPATDSIVRVITASTMIPVVSS